MCFIGSTGKKKKKRHFSKKPSSLETTTMALLIPYLEEMPRSFLWRKKKLTLLLVRSCLCRLTCRNELSEWDAQALPLRVNSSGHVSSHRKKPAFLCFLPRQVRAVLLSRHADGFVIVPASLWSGPEHTSRYWQQYLLANNVWINNSEIKTTIGKQMSNAVPEATWCEFKSKTFIASVIK